VSEPTPNSEQAPPERRRRLTPEVRRAQILAAALEVFTGLGFERATLQDVADRAGVTKGALYHYFESKDQLFTELVHGYLGELVQAGDLRVAQNEAGLSREELLRAHLEAMWSTLQLPHMLGLSQLILMELPKFPDLGRGFFEDVVIPSRRTTRRILVGREIRAEPADDIDALAAALPSMLLGVALTQRLFQDVDPLQLDGERLGQVIVDALLAGIPAIAVARDR